MPVHGEVTHWQLLRHCVLPPRRQSRGSIRRDGFVSNARYPAFSERSHLKSNAGPAEDFAGYETYESPDGPLVPVVGDEGKFVVRDVAEAGALGEVLAQPAVWRFRSLPVPSGCQRGQSTPVPAAVLTGVRGPRTPSRCRPPRTTGDAPSGQAPNNSSQR